MKNIDNSNSTVFKCSLDEIIDLTKNNIYSITLFLAWIEVQKILKSKKLSIDNKKLSTLNEYIVISTPLEVSEFNREVNIKNDKINIKIDFKKSLPFSKPARLNVDPLLFGNDKLQSFSPKDYTEIVYYNNENDFAIRLNFEDDRSEMILIKTNFIEGKSLKDYLPVLENEESGLLFPDDILEIPEITFKLESKFPEMKNTRIFHPNDGRKAVIEEISQKVKFELDHKGASVESETRIELKPWSCVFPEKRTMVFNKPFAVYLKKKNNVEPYFAAYFNSSDFFKPFSI